MLIVSSRILNILAALVWFGGGVALSFKGAGLLLEANRLRPELDWHWLAGASGLFIGALKARFLFSKSCRKNLDRITALDMPRIWQFYRLRFFLALAVLVWGSAKLSSHARDNYLFLIFMAVLDLSIATALLGSGHIYWRQNAFRKCA